MTDRDHTAALKVAAWARPGKPDFGKAAPSLLPSLEGKTHEERASLKARRRSWADTEADGGGCVKTAAIGSKCPENQIVADSNTDACTNACTKNQDATSGAVEQLAEAISSLSPADRMRLVALLLSMPETNP